MSSYKKTLKDTQIIINRLNRDLKKANIENNTEEINAVQKLLTQFEIAFDILRFG